MLSLGIAALSLAVSVASASDTTQLLATLHQNIDSGRGASFGTPPTISSMSVAIGYVHPTGNDPCIHPVLGCEPVPVEELSPGATFEFDSASRNFEEVTYRLANADTTELFYQIQLAFTSDGELVMGGSGGGPEGLAFGPTLLGRNLSRVTLTIHSLTITTTVQPEYWNVLIEGTAEWRFYGNDAPVPARHTTWGSLKSRYR